MTEESNLESILSKIGYNSLHDQDIDSDDLTLQKKRFENKRYQEDTRSRKYLAYWAATIVSIYLIAVLIILVFNDKYVCLSDTVLSVLLGTTTFNVLGLMYIVLKGYFKADNLES
jgi:ABC-type transport system involved in cytochrome c biogenesis permease component